MTTRQQRGRRLQQAGNIGADQPRPRETAAPPGSSAAYAIVTSVTVPVGDTPGIMLVRQLTYTNTSAPEEGDVTVGDEVEVFPIPGLTYDQYLWMVFDWIDEATTPVGVKAYPVRVVGQIAEPIFKVDSGVEFVDDSLSASEGSSS